MKSFKLIFVILIIFFKTGNVLSNEDIFNVNNIELLKKPNISNKEMANQAIKKGFETLKEKILLRIDAKKLSNLSFNQIKELVSYYQVRTSNDENIKDDKFIYNISFDKDKLHNLFYNNDISYAEITNKEIFLLPIFLSNNQIFIYNQNYFYEKWSLVNEKNKKDFIEFILPLENIEIIEKINSKKDNLLNLDLKDLYPEYDNKNLALILIEDTNSKTEKIFLKTKILEKNIDKSIFVKRADYEKEKFYNEIISSVNKELINLLKSQNLIDIKTPSFLNTKFKVNKNYNLVELKRRIEKIDLIDQIYVQEFNKDYMMLKIKYLGKLSKIIKQLENQKIILKLIGDQWNLRLI